MEELEKKLKDSEEERKFIVRQLMLILKNPESTYEDLCIANRAIRELNNKYNPICES